MDDNYRIVAFVAFVSSLACGEDGGDRSHKVRILVLAAARFCS